MLGKRIKELRERNGISLDNLAHNSGISIEVLNRLEDNEIEHVENHELFTIIDNLHLKSAYDFRCFGESLTETLVCPPRLIRRLTGFGVRTHRNILKFVINWKNFWIYGNQKGSSGVLTLKSFNGKNMISINELRRNFGPIVAVNGVSFNVGKGEVLGLLGPNGAGKSTLMKMLACFQKPDSGTATICGYDIIENPVEVRKSIGYLAENVPLYNEMTVGDFLNFICDAREIKGKNRKQALDRIVPMCSVESVYHQTIDTLSKGYKRRVGLAQTLIHDPDVLILDEPTDGLDPNQKHEVRDLINNMSKDKCIIVSTHILEEVEAVCSRTIIIAKGEILVDSTPEKLKKEHQCGLDEIFRKITRTKAA